MSYPKGIVLGLLLVLAALLTPSLVLAHAELLHSEPEAGAVLDASPDRVRLFFSEPIEPDFFALEVYAPDETRVDQRDAHIPADEATALEASLPPLQPGSYTVRWRVLSIDGHVVRGAFAFSVGGTPAAAGPLDLPNAGAPVGLSATVRWWTFLAAFILVGGLGFGPLVLWPALRAAGVDGPAPAARATRGLLWLAWPALVLLLGLSLAALLLQASEVTGSPLADVFSGRAVTRLLTRTRYGLFWVARLCLLFGLLAVLAAIASEKQSRAWLRWLGLALGAGILLTIAASGHASSVAGRTGPAVAADWLHLVAGAVWVGGLAQLIVGLGLALRPLDAGARRALLAQVVRRFSWLAGASVLLLVATGVYASLLHVPNWQALLDTVYGAALSGKLLLVLPLLALGAANLLVMHPLLLRDARSQSDSAAKVLRARLFRGLVLGELLLGALVLGVTGLLAGLPPATSAPGEGAPFTATQPAGSLALTLHVMPNQAGANSFEIRLAGADGQPVQADRVALALEHQEMAMDRREVLAQPVAPGQYAASGNALNMAGRWNVEVTVEGSGQPPARSVFQVGVGQPPSAGRVAFSPARILLNALTPSAALGASALLLAAALFWERARWRPGRGRQLGTLVGAVLAATGLWATGATLASAYRASLPNPVPATAESLEHGRQIYLANCASCHGFNGRGDGPAGRLLRPRPADFRVHMAEGHTDADLHAWIAGGVDGTGMPAFRDTLSEEEIWHVVNYIRTFGAPASAAR